MVVCSIYTTYNIIIVSNIFYTVRRRKSYIESLLQL